MNGIDIWKNLYEQRGGTHGHLPLTDDIIDFFKKVGKITKPKNILEFGTNLGGSAAMQLSLNPKANLVTMDPITWNVTDATVYYPDSFMSTHRGLYGDTLAVSLLKIIYGDRFTFLNRSSKWVKDLVEDDFDYAFIDGSHVFLDVYNDIQNCIDLNIPYLLIDNIAQDEDAIPKRLQVKQAVEAHSNLLEEIDSVTYEIEHPVTWKKTSDAIVLYKVKV
jgi:predicted O-methyltransferase YrrM